MSTLLCSTGCLIGRPNGRNYHLIGEFVKDLEYDGLEFMMYSDWYQEVDALLTELLSQKLFIPVVHCQKSIGEVISLGGAENWKDALGRFEMNCQIAKTLGAEKMVMHLWDGMTSDQFFENNLRAYGELFPIAQSFGIDLLIENVVCNQENPMKHWCELVEQYPDIHFIFDTKMAAFHGQLELLYEDRYSFLWKEKHIRHFHVNDYHGGYLDWKSLKTLPVGYGNIDFDRFFAFLHEIGYDGTLTVEATAFGQDGKVDLEMLNRCAAVIREKLAHTS